MESFCCVIPHIFHLFVSYTHHIPRWHRPFTPLWYKIGKVTFPCINFKWMVHHQILISIPRQWFHCLVHVNINRNSSSLCIIYSPSSISTLVSLLCLFTKISSHPIPSPPHCDPPLSINTHSPGPILLKTLHNNFLSHSHTKLLLPSWYWWSYSVIPAPLHSEIPYRPFCDCTGEYLQLTQTLLVFRAGNEFGCPVSMFILS